MKLWSELDIQERIITTSSVPVNQSQSSSSTGSTFYQPVPENQQQAIIIPAPTVNSLMGSVEFIQVSGTTELPMPFEQRTGKDIEVVTDQPIDVMVKDKAFSSTNLYPIGTRFKLKVINDAFTYIIALNSDGVKILHPNVRTQNTGKDIEVIQEATPTAGNVTIPVNGTFAITPSKTGIESPSDDLAIMLSKSELIAQELLEKLNAVSGSLSERIAQVFGAEQIPAMVAGIQNEGNLFSFNGNNTSQNILPLVFKIRKQ